MKTVLKIEWSRLLTALKINVANYLWNLILINNAFYLLTKVS